MLAIWKLKLWRSGNLAILAPWRFENCHCSLWRKCIFAAKINRPDIRKGSELTKISLFSNAPHSVRSGFVERLDIFFAHCKMRFKVLWYALRTSTTVAKLAFLSAWTFYSHIAERVFSSFFDLPKCVGYAWCCHFLDCGHLYTGGGVMNTVPP